MEHFTKGLQSQDGAAGNKRFNDSPRYEDVSRPELLYESLQTGGGIRAASIVTEQHSKNKVFNFAEQEILTPQNRQKLRGGKVTGIVGPEHHRVSLHQVDKRIVSRSPPGNKQLARLHSATNLVRRVGDEDQALMAHRQDSGLMHPGEEDVSSFNPESSNQDPPNTLRKKTSQREAPAESNAKVARRTLMESAQQSLTVQTLPTATQRSANPNATGIVEKISPQKAGKETMLARLQKSPPASQSKTQIIGENLFWQKGVIKGNSSSRQNSSCEDSREGEIQLPNLNRRKSKMSSTISAFLEDAGQQILDSSLNQSFNLSQTASNYQVAGEIQHNKLLLSGVVGQSNIRESSADFWKSATSQTSAPITKLQSERQIQVTEKLDGGLTKQERQQMTSKKAKPIQMLKNKQQNDQAEQQKLPGHHRNQQSMDLQMPFKQKIDKNATKNERGAKVFREKKTNAGNGDLQPEELKSCLTERVGKAAAGSSTTSAATQNKNVQPGSSSGQQTRNGERSRLTRNLHHQHLQQSSLQPDDSIVSNQTTGGGSTGSQRSSGGQKLRLSTYNPSNTEISGREAKRAAKGNYFSISRQLAPSNSSIPQDSGVDDDKSSQEDEYQSMWAAISKSIDQTNESNYQNQVDDGSYAVDVDQETELSGFQYLFNQSICPSNLGQADQNSSFHGSQSQASQWGQDLDSSFYESATNSNWAKSDRNSYALKSQHSQSTYTKQKGVGAPQQQVAQQPPQTQTPKSQVQHQNQGVSQAASGATAWGYARRSSAIEESKGGTGVHGGATAGQSANAAIQPADDQPSPVNSSASSTQKFISQQKAHRNAAKVAGGMQTLPSQDSSLQTPSKDHQTMLRQHKLHSQSTATMAVATSERTGGEPMTAQTAPNRHGGYLGMHRGTNEDTQMIIPPDARTQMSQSVQPISSRNNNSVTNQIGQSLHNHQAVPTIHHQATQQFMSASRQPQYQQIQQPFDFPSPQSAQSNPPPHHAQISVSGFTATAAAACNNGAVQPQFDPTGNNPFMAIMPTMSQNQVPQQFFPQKQRYSLDAAEDQKNSAAQGNLQQHQQFNPTTMSVGHHFQPLPMSMPAQHPIQHQLTQHQQQQQSMHQQLSHPPYTNSHTMPSPSYQQQQQFQQQYQLQNHQSDHQQQQYIPTIAQLNLQLIDIQRFYESQKAISIPEFETYLEQVRSITDPFQRHQAQQNLIIYMHKSLNLNEAPQQLVMTGGQRHHFQGPAGVGYDHRRDYSSSSSASKISSSSHHSSVSSQHRSSHQNNLKLALAQAFHDLKNIQSPEEHTQFLIQKAPLLAKDKNGFQLLKNKIDEEAFQLQQQQREKAVQQPPVQSNFVQALFNQLFCTDYTHFHKLMMHQVANFFCQELFKQATKKQLEQVLETIKNDFCKIAADMHGTRALQVLLEDELIKNEKRTDRTPALIFESLKSGRIFDMCCNIRGNHRLRECLVLLKTDEKRSIIYEPVVQHFAQIARDKHGCQVVKECITTAQGHQKKDLIKVSLESIEMLINDEFGNFVIQAILEHYISISKRKSKIMNDLVSCVYEFIRCNLGNLCKQQYSSHVVEKAVETMPKDQFEKLCQIIMKSNSKKCKMYKDIMLDGYGNYIAPKILEKAKIFALQHQFDYFNKVYRDSIEALKGKKHGRQLMSKMNQISQQQTNNTQQQKSKTTVQAMNHANQSASTQQNLSSLPQVDDSNMMLGENQ